LELSRRSVVEALLFMVGMPARRISLILFESRGNQVLTGDRTSARTPDGLLHVTSPDRRYVEEKTIRHGLQRSVGDARDSRDIGKSTIGDYMD
jgi:hypothetical protein